ncbi:MAG TPA: hypothetical protein VGL79_01515 [Solirubrobacteraceae bacterium]
MDATTSVPLDMFALASLRGGGDRESRAASRAGGLLVALLGLCAMLCATNTSLATAAGSRSLCSAQHHCARTAALAHTSNSEAEEPEEEELEESGEEAATAEAEAEEAEDGETSSPATSSAGPVAISNLKLTARATATLAHRLPAASAIAFSFTLSARASVHVTIVRQTGMSGHERWATLPDSLTLSVAKGHDARSLKGHNRLSAGRYRLTLKPTGGRSRSIYLSVQP